MIAARHILFEKRHPYDTKLEYIEISGAAYFSLRNYLTANVIPWGTTDDWKLRIGVVDPSQNGDKKMFGKTYAYGIAIYSGGWRPSFVSGWPFTQVKIATYPIVDFIAGRDYAELKSVDGEVIFKDTSGKVGWNSGEDYTVGTMVSDSGSILPPSNICAHRIYSFSRIKDGKLAFDFIPCIMDGVVGMYEDISGVFYSSQTTTPFIAGPKIK